MTEPEADTERAPALSSELIQARKDRAKARRKRNRERVHDARAALLERLLSKAEVLAVTGLSYPTLWQMMRHSRFPRSRIVGGKSMWFSTEIDAWLAGLPVRPLKGDADSASARGAE
jgi:predicted DNA-binding transcriptional regulator AlpA